MKTPPEYVYQEPIAVIGDIHGCASLLSTLLSKLGSRPILVTGDVGDRGPETPRVLDILISRGAKGVLGNHDQWFQQLAVHRQFDRIALTSCVGGRATLQSYGFTDITNKEAVETQAAEKIPAAHRNWLKGLPLMAGITVQGEKYWLSHAGIPRLATLQNLPPDRLVPEMMDTDPEMVLWTFADPRLMAPADRPVIMGHKAYEEPMDWGHVICVDTGAGKQGRLTALLLPERTFITVG